MKGSAKDFRGKAFLYRAEFGDVGLPWKLLVLGGFPGYSIGEGRVRSSDSREELILEAESRGIPVGEIPFEPDILELERSGRIVSFRKKLEAISVFPRARARVPGFRPGLLGADVPRGASPAPGKGCGNTRRGGARAGKTGETPSGD